MQPRHSNFFTVCSASCGASLLCAAALAQPYSMRVDLDARVPMRDGVNLSANVYRPDAPGRFPVILTRTPYNKAGGGGVDRYRAKVATGYVCVAMDVRGRGDSDGTFAPFRQEGPDGFDSVEWCGTQPWSSGKVGMTGGSYDGYTCWAAAVQAPPHLTTIVPMVPCPDPFVDGIQAGPTGLPGPIIMGWYQFVSGQLNQPTPWVDWPTVFKHLPLSTMDEAAGKSNAPWDAMIDHAQLSDWWEPARYQNKFDRVKIPVLHVSGWYDDEQVSTLINFTGMTGSGIPGAVKQNQRLVMGAWPHAVNSGTRIGQIEFGPTARIDLDGMVGTWFDHWLKGEENKALEQAPVRVFVMGANVWRDEKEWPIARTAWTNYYLHSAGSANTLDGDGTLSTDVPSAEPADEYTYDPADPIPFITDPSFAQVGGPDDYRQIEKRPDVLVYTTPAMTRDTEVCGPIRAKLWAISSAKDTDFNVRLIHVRPDGFAQRLCDGVVRARFRKGMDKPELIEPGKAYEYEVDCWNTCQTFQPGSRIRVEISSSSFPQWDRNPNTGGPLGKEAAFITARQKILHDRDHPSHLVLPVVPTGP